MKPRTTTLRQELLAHTKTDLEHHAETKKALAGLSARVDKLTDAVLDSFQSKEELSVAKRKATLSDDIDKRKTRRAIAKKALLVVLAVAGALAGAAVNGCDSPSVASYGMGRHQHTNAGRDARHDDTENLARTKGHDDE